MDRRHNRCCRHTGVTRTPLPCPQGGSSEVCGRSAVTSSTEEEEGGARPKQDLVQDVVEGGVRPSLDPVPAGLVGTQQATVTAQRISHELPRCNWLEDKIKDLELAQER